MTMLIAGPVTVRLMKQGAFNMTKAAIAAVGVGVLLALAPPAHAGDEGQYIADLQNAGIMSPQGNTSR
jgi:hypothetical protein